MTVNYIICMCMSDTQIDKCFSAVHEVYVKIFCGQIITMMASIKEQFYTHDTKEFGLFAYLETMNTLYATMAEQGHLHAHVDMSFNRTLNSFVHAYIGRQDGGDIDNMMMLYESALGPDERDALWDIYKERATRATKHITEIGAPSFRIHVHEDEKKIVLTSELL